MVHPSSGGTYRLSTVNRVAPPAVSGDGGSNALVKLEIESEEENGPSTKRMKQSSLSDQLNLQWIPGSESSPVAPSQYNPLDEPSPLGLRLKKSPSLLELIQKSLSQGNASAPGSASSENSKPRQRAVRGSDAAKGSNEKLKASNFAASLLRIGDWEYASRYEGDLVVKCYFAKHKLVWEILDGGLKSKIEIPWSDIMGLNTKFPEDGPSTMTLVLARQPLFFRETNPQPRRHTLWQASADFTDGQASMHRQHFLQVPAGVLNRHFEKLIQCDMRLNFLSCQPEMVLDSPYFESIPPALEDSKNSHIHTRSQSIGTNISAFPGGASPSVSQTSSVVTEQENVARGESLSHEAPSPISVMDTCATEGCVTSDGEILAGPKNWQQLIIQGLRPSMSMTDLVNHIGSCISGQGSTENPNFPAEGSESRQVLEDIAQHLLGDSQLTTCSDDKSLMLRVNSLCSLLQKDGTPVQLNADKKFEDSEDQKETQMYTGGTEGSSILEKPTKGDTGDSGGDSKDFSSCKPALSRKDSYGDLLHNLPRIASLPKFLFDISEAGDNQADESK